MHRATSGWIPLWTSLRFELMTCNCSMEDSLQAAHDGPGEVLPDSCNIATQHVNFQTSDFRIQTSRSWRGEAPPSLLPAQWYHRRTEPEAMQPWPCPVTAASFALGDEQSNSNRRTQPAPSQPGTAEGTVAPNGRSARPDFSVAYALAANDREPGIVPLVTLGNVFTLIKERCVSPCISVLSLYEGHDIQ